MTQPPPTRSEVHAVKRILGSARREPWLVGFGVFIATLNIVALFLVNNQTASIRTLAVENRKVLAVQVPTLRARIAERDATIADLQAVQDQAIAAIIQLSDQVEALGGKPPKIVLQPPKREEP